MRTWGEFGGFHRGIVRLCVSRPSDHPMSSLAWRPLAWPALAAPYLDRLEIARLLAAAALSVADVVGDDT